MSVHVSLHVFDEPLTMEVAQEDYAGGSVIFLRLRSGDGNVSICLEADTVRAFVGQLAKAGAELRSIADKKDADRLAQPLSETLDRSAAWDGTR